MWLNNSFIPQTCPLSTCSGTGFAYFPRFHAQILTMKRLFTLLFILLVTNGYSQNGTAFRVVTSTATNIGRGLRDAKQAQDRNREMEEAELRYDALIVRADTLFTNQQYQEAIDSYTEAMRIRPNEYPREQIIRAQVELDRVNQETYQLTIDRADSLYRKMEYEQAIAQYKEALTIRDRPYPKDQIANINADLMRWKKVHFSGLVISDTRVEQVSSGAYQDDPYSDFIGAGKYAWIDRFLTYANFQTLDGIAVPPNVRLVIYSEKDFKGKVILDVTGPAVINNTQLQKSAESSHAHTKTYDTERLQTTFPQTTRSWSESNMQSWINGSMEIIVL